MRARLLLAAGLLAAAGLGLAAAQQAVAPAEAPPRPDPATVESVVVVWRAAESGVAEVPPGVLVRAATRTEPPEPEPLERVEIVWDERQP